MTLREPQDPELRAVLAKPWCGLWRCDGRPTKITQGYEEHASYPIRIELPTCLAHGIRAVDCQVCPATAPMHDWPAPVRPRPLDPALRARLAHWTPKTMAAPTPGAVGAAPTCPRDTTPNPPRK